MKELIAMSRLTNFDEAIAYNHLPINAKSKKHVTRKDHSPVVYIVNGEVELHCALIPIDDGCFIMINKQLQ